MVSKGHFARRFLPREPDEDKGNDKAQQIGNQVEGITDDRDGMRDDAADELAGDEDKGDDDDNDEFLEVAGVVLLGGRLVQLPVFVLLLLLLLHYKQLKRILKSPPYSQQKQSTMAANAPPRALEILHSKFARKNTLQLFKLATMANWSDSPRNLCRELATLSEEELGDKYVWLVGSNPAYFIQYQVDSYAIFRGHGKVILVWKPKYIEYPAVVKLEDFGENPKKIKSMEIKRQESSGDMSEALEACISEHLQQFYGAYYFTLKEQQFETKLMSELKHYASRVSKVSYWHCAIDNHNNVDVSTRGALYMRLRVTGVRDRYDKDILLVSKQGQREFMLKGKYMQVMSFLGMLLIFIAVMQCPEGVDQGICKYKNELMLLGAAIMMGLMGMRVAGRNREKNKLQKKVQEEAKKEK